MAGLLSSDKILTKYVSFHKAIQSISEYAGYKGEKIWRLFNMNLLEMVGRLPDFRRKQGQRYPLAVIMVITIMSIMSGRYRYREIAAFAEANKKELLKFFGLKRKRLPSHVTFREILKGVNFDDVLNGFNKWASEYVTIEAKEWLSLDGKALGSTVTEYDSSYQNFVSFVSVFTHKRGQVIACGLLENKKSSEIPKVKELIEALDLQDVVFTLDALHCQKNCRSNSNKRKPLCNSGKRKSSLAA